MLSIDSILPYFAIMALLLALASAICRWVPFYRSTCGAAEPARFETLDGLRGYLALAVFFHHAVIQYQYYRTGEWGRCDSRFYSGLGPTGVMYFFMITGFLFWSKAIAKKGRVLPWALYKNRLLRLGPLFAFSLCIILLLVAEQSSFRLAVRPAALLGQLARACSLGLGMLGVINGVNTWPINAGVTWSLRYEWAYYLALPVLAIAATPRRFAGLVLAAGVVYVCSVFWLPNLLGPQRYLFHFFCGMLAAHVVQRYSCPRPEDSRKTTTPISIGLKDGEREQTNPPRRLPAASSTVPGRFTSALSQRLPRLVNSGWATVVVLALLGASLMLPRTFLGLAMGALAFLGIVFGNRLGGLLTVPGAKLLGTISYSIYLLHGIILYVLLALTNHFLPIAGMQSHWYWLLIACLGSLVVLASALTYRLVEHPFIELSHKRRAKASIRPAAESQTLETVYPVAQGEP